MSIKLTDDHRMTAQVCGSIIQMVRLLDVEVLTDIVRFGREYDNVGSIMDPTGWMAQHPQNQQDTDIYEAVLKFRKALDELARVHQ